ncbi:hypothetical protein Tco_0873782 [Tanacetum coccineum]|uniref:Uncharacterized protein n=1 Tax=Tanacetum coccineum TaxID=301880 RepID=A0ABQ5BMZ1_9ASTR
MSDGNTRNRCCTAQTFRQPWMPCSPQNARAGFAEEYLTETPCVREAVAPVDAENWISHNEKQSFDVMDLMMLLKIRLALQRELFFSSFFLRAEQEHLKGIPIPSAKGRSENSTDTCSVFLRLAGFLTAAGTSRRAAKNCRGVS